MSIGLVTILMFCALLVALGAGVPIAFGLGGIAMIFSYFLWGPSSLFNFVLGLFSNGSDFILVALPGFFFMANMLERSGIADDLFELMYRWLGPMRGGLAIGTVIICTIFAAISGISGAATVTMGLIALPAMLKRGYNKDIAIGCIAAGGALGILIPPSIEMILYGYLAQESVGRLFAGGILPGLMLSGLFILYIGVRCFLQPKMGPALPKDERGSWGMKLSALKAVILPFALVVMVLGSIFSGMATPTEAAGVGAFGSVLCALIMKRFNWKSLKQACQMTLKFTAMVMWIVIAAKSFVSVYTALGAPQLIQDMVVGLGANPLVVLIGIQLILFIMGMVMDVSGIVMLCTPVFLPIIKAYGFDGVWFGVLFTVNMEMALLTPPFGINLFYMRGVAPKGVTMDDIMRSVFPFVGLQLVGLVLCMVFPAIILTVPNMLFGPQ